jgi:hypothetical protein
LSVLSIDAKPIHLEDLLNSVESGTAVLPAFQRDFDWSDSDVVSLLATLLSGWPAGSLLLMNGNPTFFDVRPFEDGPEVSNSIKLVVLDGQQRLTALYRALRGKGESVFVLDASKLVGAEPDADDLEEAIRVIPRRLWSRDYDFDRQRRESLVPLSVFKTASDYFAWRDRIIESTPASDRTSVGKLYADVYRNHLGKLNTYAFPVVLLDNDLPPAAVARIFERINRTGLRLSTFDLLVARVYDQDWNLRLKWNTARREIEPIAHWLGEDGLPVVQAISLHLDSDVRQPAMLALRNSDIRAEWDNAVDNTARAIEKLRDIGVPSPNWMPYRGLLLPLAELAARNGPSALQNDHGRLATWFWGRSFALNYDVGSSTRIVSDAKLLTATEGDFAHDEFMVDRQVLLNSTRKQQGALWSAFLSLLSSCSARDLVTGEVLEDPADDAVPVSLFPRTGSGDMHLRVLGLVLLSRKSAAKLRKDRLGFLKEINPEAARSQLLPADGLLESLLDPGSLFENRLASIERHLATLSTSQILWYDGRPS